MESQMQQQYDAADAHIETLVPFMDDLADIIKKHNVCKEDIEMVIRYMGVK